MDKITMIFEQIKGAHRYAIGKHRKFPSNPFEQLALATEEAGEIAKALNDCKTGLYKDAYEARDHINEEILQTIAVYIRMLEGMANDETLIEFGVDND
jgi:NTP pyrophosphatase (non-canonical NTP hydrolase)